MDRGVYFEALFEAQRGLAMFQDWDAATEQKVVVIFEERDAAGQDGAIKHITQRLNAPISGSHPGESWMLVARGERD